MEPSGSVGRVLDWGSRVASSRITAGSVTVLCPQARHFIHCLVLVQPRKTHPYMTENFVHWGLRIKTKLNIRLQLLFCWFV